jgi:hypothetical protein
MKQTSDIFVVRARYFDTPLFIRISIFTAYKKNDVLIKRRIRYKDNNLTHPTR